MPAAVDWLTAMGDQLETELAARNTSAAVGERVKLTLKRSLAALRPAPGVLLANQ